jgi:hypothetical protein
MLESADILFAASDVLSREGAKQASEGPFRLRSALRPGETGRMVLGISTAADSLTTSIRLEPGDLVSDLGRIAASQIMVEPNSLVIGPGNAQDVTVTVSIPSAVKAGRYVGPLTASGQDGFVATLEVIVQR